MSAKDRAAVLPDPELMNTLFVARRSAEQLYDQVAAAADRVAAAEARAAQAEAKALRLEARLKALPKLDANLAIAAWALIDRLEEMLPEDFARAGEARERKALRAILDERAGVDEDLPPAPQPAIERRRISVAAARSTCTSVRNLRWHARPIEDTMLDRLLVACESMADEVDRSVHHWRMNRTNRWLRLFARQLRIRNDRAAAAYDAAARELAKGDDRRDAAAAAAQRAMDRVPAPTSARSRRKETP